MKTTLRKCLFLVALASGAVLIGASDASACHRTRHVSACHYQTYRYTHCYAYQPQYVYPTTYCYQPQYVYPTTYTYQPQYVYPTAYTYPTQSGYQISYGYPTYRAN